MKDFVSGTLIPLMVFMVAGLGACASAGQRMVARRHAFEAQFIPTWEQYESLSEAMQVYEMNVRRIAREVGWSLTDIDELGLAAVKAIAARADRGEMTRSEALLEMRRVEGVVMAIYRRRQMEAAQRWITLGSLIAAWNLYSPQYFYSPAFHRPIHCTTWQGYYGMGSIHCY